MKKIVTRHVSGTQQIPIYLTNGMANLVVMKRGGNVAATVKLKNSMHGTTGI